MNKAEELKFIVGRFDHYYDSINNKGNLYLTINTFILAGVIGGFAALSQSFDFGPGVVVSLLIPTLLSNLASVIYTLQAIKPYTSGRGQRLGNSLLFFVDIAGTPEAEWSDRWDTILDSDWEADLRSQAKLLATGLQDKFQSLQKATLFIGIQVFFIFLFAVYLFLIYKS